MLAEAELSAVFSLSPRVPGPPHDVRCTEVRDSSLRLLWEAPLYQGAGPVTGYFLELCEEGSEDWKQINKQPTGSTHMKVCTCPQCPGVAAVSVALIAGCVPAGGRSGHR